MFLGENPWKWPFKQGREWGIPTGAEGLGKPPRPMLFPACLDGQRAALGAEPGDGPRAVRGLRRRWRSVAGAFRGCKAANLVGICLGSRGLSSLQRALRRKGKYLKSILSFYPPSAFAEVRSAAPCGNSFLTGDCVSSVRADLRAASGFRPGPRAESCQNQCQACPPVGRGIPQTCCDQRRLRPPIAHMQPAQLPAADRGWAWGTRQ